MSLIGSRLMRPLRQLQRQNFQLLHQVRILNPFVVDTKDIRTASNQHGIHLQSTCYRPWRADPSFQCDTILFSHQPISSTIVLSGSTSLLNFELPLHHQIRLLHYVGKGRLKTRSYSSKKDTDSPNSEQPPSEPTPPPVDDKDLTLYQRFKKTYKEHGKVLVVVHLLTSAVWFSTFYAAARCGVDIVPLLESWNFSDRVISPFRSGGLGDIALAYLMYKLATPARYTVTIGGTNLAIRHLRKGGKMPPVPKEDSLRQLYKEGKADLKSKGSSTKRQIRHMHTRIRGRIRKGRKRMKQDP